MIRFKFALFALTFITGSAYAREGLDQTGATVKGSLDKEIIRNVIRRHLHEVKRCYEAGLEKNKQLAGRVMIDFTIQPDGKVSGARTGQTTLGDQAVETCIVKAVGAWEFPRPKGGSVQVSYPFVLASSDPGEDKAGSPKAR